MRYSGTAWEDVTTNAAYKHENGQLAIDASYSFILKATDTVGTVTTYVGEINSAAYIMHVKKGGKALGFGTAAGADETVTFAWP